MELFEEIKQEILERAHKANACKEQYGRAYKSKCIEELCEVIKDNFHWCCINSVLDGELIDKFKDTFSENKIYHNVSVNTGYLYAYGSATVEASGSATVEAYGFATVKAYDSATVKAYDSAYINCHSTIECVLLNKAIVRRWDTNTIQYASDKLTFEKIETKS